MCGYLLFVDEEDREHQRAREEAVARQNEKNRKKRQKEDGRAGRTVHVEARD